jgi:hypothetical protein
MKGMGKAERIRWARKVSQAKIRQLYETDARGIVDQELIDEVGTALYARCQSIMLVSKARIRCPRCGQVVQVEPGGPGERAISCPAQGCGWGTTYRQWHNSWRHQDLIGSKAFPAFETYLGQYDRAKDPREKMLLIDQLIHAFHRGIQPGMPHRSAANNLIEGSHNQVVQFLDRLAYGDGSTAGTEERRAQWREEMEKVWRMRGAR